MSPDERRALEDAIEMYANLRALLHETTFGTPAWKSLQKSEEEAWGIIMRFLDAFGSEDGA